MNFANSLELYGSFPEYDSIPFAVPQCLPPPMPTLLLPPTPLLLPSSPFEFQRGHKKNKTHKKSNLKAKLNTYRTYPALCQAIEAHAKATTTDLSDLMKILELLHCMLDAQEFEITSINKAAAALVCSSESLDVEHRKLSEKEVDIGRHH
ncbi:hypothetical protein BS47DRAFT_1390998 [Hydnum rufescens UP504]|uniref:Uncharacterized protein n=1 Tax=Hydnum rufescens UP504 TaxID=1448309 RepID=A0A9P6DYQ6_9AGAM|nr:hypothetical protein BS47DRAFT_1390998 [Hydnum rufescens UP504]